MTPAELSRELALAIGYAPESVRIIPSDIAPEHEFCTVFTDRYACTSNWYDFDYREPDIAMPLLEWLMRTHRACAMVSRAEDAFCIMYDFYGICGRTIYSKTLPEAIARAVIAVKGRP